MEIRPIFSALLRSKTAPMLVALQVAISLAVLANALYVVNLRLTASARPSGIASESDVFYMRTSAVKKPDHQEALDQQRLDSKLLAAIPGVMSVAIVSQMPMSQSGSTSGIALDRRQVNTSASVSIYTSPDSLIKTFGLNLVEGSDFNPSDVIEFDRRVDDQSTKFAKHIIITKALAEFLYPSATSVVGKSIYFGTGDEAPELRIVGVVEKLQSSSAGANAKSEYSVILPVRLSDGSHLYAVRVEPGQRDRVIAEAETSMRKASSTPRIVRTKTVEADRASRYRDERSLSWMLISVCALLLLVTASGIVGMTTLRVTQRRKIIGVRRALGARRQDILRHFVVENVLITSTGIVIGVLLAIALNQLLVSQVSLPKLPMAYLLYGAGLLWLISLIAVYGPAWRAATISPAMATRSA